MRFFVLLFLLVIVPAVARAQSPTSPLAELPKTIRFYYAGFSVSGDEVDPDAKFLLKSGRETVAVQLHANAFSEAIDYTGSPLIRLFRERRTETGMEREDLGQLQFPAEWKGALFIVTRDPANARLPFRFYPIEYWGPSVPDEHLRILNLCPYPLAAKVGANQMAVNAGASADVALPPDRPDIPLRLAARRQDQWERILSTGILRPEQNKLLVLTFPQPDGVARVLVLRDLPEPPEETVPRP
jgi:hypothetical protein